MSEGKAITSVVRVALPDCRSRCHQDRSESGEELRESIRAHWVTSGSSSLPRGSWIRSFIVWSRSLRP